MAQKPMEERGENARKHVVKKCWTDQVDKNIAIYRPASPPGFESSGRSGVENARKLYCDECKYIEQWRTCSPNQKYIYIRPVTDLGTPPTPQGSGK